MPPWALGSSRLRVVTAMSWLLGLLVGGVLVTPPAVLAQLDPIGIVLLVLQGGVVAPFADAAGEGDDFFHAWLFGGGKEKSLGSLGLVNSSRRSPGPIDRPPEKDYKAGNRPPVSKGRGSHAGVQTHSRRVRRLGCAGLAHFGAGAGRRQPRPDPCPTAGSLHRAAVRRRRGRCDRLDRS